MGWLIHGSLNPRGISTGRHGARLLLDASAQADEASLPTGHDAVDQALREHFVRAWHWEVARDDGMHWYWSDHRDQRRTRCRCVRTDSKVSISATTALRTINSVQRRIRVAFVRAESHE